MKKKSKSKVRESTDADKRKAARAMVIVPDTSVIIEGLVSKKITNGEIRPKQIIIHEAVLAELEHQANQSRETGYLGLEEVRRIRDIAKQKNIKIEFVGKRPKEFEIRFAKSGEIDSLMRDIAYERKATLITADKVQSLVAEAKGINVILIRFEVVRRQIRLEKFFDEKTMSVHIRENIPIHAKKGMPGKWDFVVLREEPATHEELKEMASEIVEEATLRRDGFIEIERKGSTIVQLGAYRIVITKPPFSDGWEITAVRPIKRLDLNDYKLSDKLMKRVVEQAEGILIAGAPGMGKSTFAQALAEFYASKKKIVKTVEAPRDLQLSDSITQYAISHGSSQEIHDVLLLSRPDYTIFDEMRNTEDFRLFSDLRLSGVGMVGVVHGTKAIDAIQRFIGRIELGVIPHIIDTVVFIKNGAIDKVFSVQMEVKVPAGMTEADLARPVVTVNDFESNKQEFEVYSYGEETVVVPVQESKGKAGASKIAANAIRSKLLKYVQNAEVDVVSNSKCIVYVPQKDIAGLIGKGGETIERIEKEIGIGIDVRELEGEPAKSGKPVAFELEMKSKHLALHVDRNLVGKNVDIFVAGNYILSANVGKKAEIRIKKNNPMGMSIMNALRSKERIEVRVE